MSLLKAEFLDIFVLMSIYKSMLGKGFITSGPDLVRSALVCGYRDIGSQELMQDLDLKIDKWTNR